MEPIKRLISAILTLALLAGFLPSGFVPARAEAPAAGIGGTEDVTPAPEQFLETGEWRYYLDGQGDAVIAGYTNPSASSLSLPYELNGHPVSGIASGALSGFGGLSVLIHSMVTHIAADSLADDATVRAYSGAYALKYAAGRGLKYVNLTNAGGEYTFTAQVIDMGGFSDAAYHMDSRTTVRVSERIAGLIRVGDIVYLPRSSAGRTVAGGRVKEIVQEGGQWQLRLEAIASASDAISHIKGATDVYVDVDHPTILTEGVTIENETQAQYRIKSDNAQPSITSTFKVGLDNIKLKKTSSSGKTSWYGNDAEDIEEGFSLGIGGNVTASLSAKLVYDFDVGLFYLNGKNGYIDASVSLTSNVYATGSISQKVKLASFKLKDPTTGLYIGEIVFSIIFGIEGKISVEWVTKYTIKAGLINNKMDKKISKQTKGPDFTGSIKGSIKAELELSVELGWDLMLFSISIQFASVKGGPVLEATAKIMKDASIVRKGVGCCTDLSLTVKLAISGEAGFVCVKINDKALPLNLSYGLKQELQLFKVSAHFDKINGEFVHVDNCTLRDRTLQMYDGSKLVRELKVNAGTLVDMDDFPAMKKAGMVFDGWWIDNAASGLNGKEEKWNYAKYSLPVIPDGKNYIFRAHYLPAGSIVTQANSYQSGNGYVSSGSYHAGGSSGSVSGGSGSYGGYYLPTLPPAPTATPTPAPTPTPVPVTQLNLNTHTGELYAGDDSRDTLQLSVELAPPTAANKDVKWSSSDEDVAYVNGRGEVLALGAGTAVITCASLSNPNVRDTCTVTVHQMVTGIYLSGNTEGMIPGDTAQARVTVFPTSADQQAVQWMSEDESVATVSASGLVTAVGVGETVIAAAATDGGSARGTLKVTVGAPLMLGVNTSGVTLELNGTEPVTIANVYVLPVSVRRMHEAGHAIEWRLTDPEDDVLDLDYRVMNTVYTVDGEEITAATVEIGSGDIKQTGTRTVEIECRAGEYTASVTVPVTVVDSGYASSATLPQTTYRLRQDEAAMIPALPTATGGTVPEHMDLRLAGDVAFDRQATVYTAAEGLAVTFGASGVYTANAIYTADNIRYTVALTFEVRDSQGILRLPVQSVTLAAPVVDVLEGQTVALTAEVLPADAYQPALTWQSDDESVATVDAQGRVTGVAPGETVIRCAAQDDSGQDANCLVRVERYLQLSDSALTLNAYTGYQTRSALEACCLTTLSSQRLAEDGLDVTWRLDKLSGDAAEVALEQYESRTGAGVRVEGNRLRLLRINGVGTEHYTLTASAGNYTASCAITLNVLDGGALPESLTLLQDSYEVSVGEALEIDPSYVPSPATALLPEDAEATLETAGGMWNAIDFTQYYGPMAMTFAQAGTYTAYVVWQSGNVRYRLPVNVTVRDEEGRVPVQAQTMRLSREQASLVIGETVQLTASVEPADAAYGQIAWSTSNSAAATVSADGLVTAIGPGTAVVTAKTTLGACYAMAAITVEGGLTLAEGEREKTVFLDGAARRTILTAWLTEATSLRLHGEPAWSLRRVSGTSLTLRAHPTETATLDGSPVYGCDIQLYSASAVGETVYELTATADGESVSTLLTVNAENKEGYLPASVTADQTAFEAGVGELIRVAPVLTCWPEGTFLPLGTTVSVAADRDVLAAADERDWFVSQSLSTFSFTEAGRYEASLVYSYSNVSYTIPVTFYIHDAQGKVPVRGKRLTLSAKSLYLEAGDTAQLRAVFTPADVTDQAVTWSSDDPTVATVTADGEVRAVGDGATAIVCTPSDSRLGPVVCQVYVEEYLTVEAGADTASLYLEGRQDNDLQTVRLSEGTAQRLARDGLTPAWQLTVSGASADIVGEASEDGTAYRLSTTALREVGATDCTLTCTVDGRTWSHGLTVDVTSLGASAPQRVTLAQPAVSLAMGETRTIDFSPVCEPAGSALPANAVSVYMGFADFYEAASTYERSGNSVTVAFSRAGRYILARTYTRRNLSYTALCVFDVAAESDSTPFLSASETECIVYPDSAAGVLSHITIEDAGILERFGDRLSWNGNVIIGDSVKLALRPVAGGMDLYLTEAAHTGVTVYRLACAFEGVQDHVDIVIDVRTPRKPLPDSIRLPADRLTGQAGEWLILPLGVQCLPQGSALPVTGDELWRFELLGADDACDVMIEQGLLKVNFAGSGYYTGTLSYQCGNVRFALPVYFTVSDEEGIVPEPDHPALWLMGLTDTVYPEGETGVIVGHAVVAENTNSHYAGVAPSWLAGMDPVWTMNVTGGTAAGLSLVQQGPDRADIVLTKLNGSGTVTYQVSCSAGGRTWRQAGQLTVADSAAERPRPTLAADSYETIEGEPVTVLWPATTGALQSAEWRLNAGQAACAVDDQDALTAVFYEMGVYHTAVRVRVSNLVLDLPVTVTVHAQEGRERAVVMRLPSALTTIEAESFRGTAVNVLDLTGTRVRHLEGYAFANCRSLTDAYLPDTLTDIASTAFSGCPYVTIHCPAGSAADLFAQDNGLKVDYTIR